MSDECQKIYEEIKDYVFINNETYELEILDNAPEEVKEKFDYWKNMEDDEIIED